MKIDEFKNISEKILSLAGIKINGNESWDIKVYNERLYQIALSHGSLGFGEFYVDKWWDCEKLDEFFYRIFRSIERSQIESNVKENWRLLFRILLFGKISIPLARVFNMQSKRKAFQAGEQHYDLGSELFKNMLDKRMVYSCAYGKILGRSMKLKRPS